MYVCMHLHIVPLLLLLVWRRRAVWGAFSIRFERRDNELGVCSHRSNSVTSSVIQSNVALHTWLSLHTLVLTHTWLCVQVKGMTQPHIETASYYAGDGSADRGYAPEVCACMFVIMHVCVCVPCWLS